MKKRLILLAHLAFLPLPGSAQAPAAYPSNFFWADYDGDGLQDALAVPFGGPARLLKNQGNGVFEDVTLQNGIELHEGATSALWLDLNGDGASDLYVGGVPGASRLWLNADGAFVDVTLQSGLELDALVLGAQAVDVDGNDLPDLYLQLDSGAALYRNIDGSFFEPVDLSPLAQPPTPQRSRTLLQAGAAADSSGGGATSAASSSSVVGAGSALTPPTGTASSSGLTASHESSFSIGVPSCVPSILDTATGVCVGASSDPQLGMLYPLSEDLFVSALGRVGIGTQAPTKKIDVAGDGRFTGGDLSIWQGNRHLTLRHDGDNAFLSNKADFVANGADAGGLLTLNGSSGIRLNYGDASTAGTEGVRLAGNGRVGIGTGEPDAQLHVVGGTDVSPTGGGFAIFGTDSLNMAIDNNQILVRNDDVNDPLQTLFLNDDGSNGSGPVVLGDVVGIGAVTATVQHKTSAVPITFEETDYSGPSKFWRMPLDSGDLRFDYSTNGVDFDGYKTALRMRSSGQVDIQVLRITGGMDIVEHFDAPSALEPGTVVVIDPAGTGSLLASRSVYDHRVAGVVSGAGGINPGLALSQEGVDTGDIPVAMTGRVYVKCTAENGSIRPGDLLTTSSVDGRAMKATDSDRWPGAVIGKAMSALDEGTGLVLVLVNLQ